MGFLFVLIVGLLAGTISGIVGTGSSIMLMPVLIYQYGPKEAVPIMAVAAVMANLSRILAWWREVDWRACLAYSVTGIPAAALGARTLLALPSHAVDIAIGLFLIAMVPVRHWLDRHQLKAQLWHLAVGGAVIGYLTGIVVSTGPLSVPLFLFYGLTKGAFLATEAASSLGLYLSKSVTFERFGALTSDVAIKGLAAGSSLMFGAFIAKRFVLHLKPDVFRLLMDGIMLAAGLSMFWNALEHVTWIVNHDVVCQKQTRAPLQTGASIPITLSAVARSAGGTPRPSALAALRLTNSNLVGCRTGKSAGLAPLRIWAT